MFFYILSSGCGKTFGESPRLVTKVMNSLRLAALACQERMVLYLLISSGFQYRILEFPF